MAARQAPFERLCSNGEQLITNGHPDSRELKKRIRSLRDSWQKLDTLAQQRRTRLEDAAESHQVCMTSLPVEMYNLFYALVLTWFQYYADANEAESWMNEKLPLVQSDDFGKDEATAKV